MSADYIHAYDWGLQHATLSDVLQSVLVISSQPVPEMKETEVPVPESDVHPLHVVYKVAAATKGVVYTVDMPAS
jgi:hypothetical protein